MNSLVNSYMPIISFQYSFATGYKRILLEHYFDVVNGDKKVQKIIRIPR